LGNEGNFGKIQNVGSILDNPSAKVNGDLAEIGEMNDEIVPGAIEPDLCRMSRN
jgi:hypothetical protein